MLCFKHLLAWNDILQYTHRNNICTIDRLYKFSDTNDIQILYTDSSDIQNTIQVCYTNHSRHKVQKIFS